jgi:hypothetical protein
MLLINVLVRFKINPLLIESIQKLDQDKVDVVIYDFRRGEDKKEAIDTDYKVLYFSFEDFDNLQQLIKEESINHKAEFLCNIDGANISLLDNFLDYIDKAFDDELVACMYSDYFGVIDETEFPVYLSSMPSPVAIPLIVCNADKYLEIESNDKIEKSLLSNYISRHIPHQLYKNKINVKK